MPPCQIYFLLPSSLSQTSFSFPPSPGMFCWSSTALSPGRECLANSFWNLLPSSVVPPYSSLFFLVPMLLWPWKLSACPMTQWGDLSNYFSAQSCLEKGEFHFPHGGEAELEWVSLTFTPPFHQYQLEANSTMGPHLQAKGKKTATNWVSDILRVKNYVSQCGEWSGKVKGRSSLAVGITGKKKNKTHCENGKIIQLTSSSTYLHFLRT